MGVLLAVVIGVLFACGLYMMNRRSIVKLIIGLVLLSHAANLLVFVAGGLTRAGSPVIGDAQSRLEPPHADPLPQALVLTAFVISFAVLAFAVVLIHRAVQSVGSDDLDRMTSTDT